MGGILDSLIGAPKTFAVYELAGFHEMTTKRFLSWLTFRKCLIAALLPRNSKSAFDKMVFLIGEMR